MKTIMCFLLTSFLFGCGAYTSELYTQQDFDIGKTIEATVGSVMMSWELGTKYKQYGNVYKTEGLRKELSYGGISQGVVQVNYREFNTSNTLAYARPAFYQDLKYDISNSKEITFQDVKLRVESADQNRIVFTILQGPAEAKVGSYKQMGRVGIRVDPNTLVVSEVFKSGPGERAGIRVGDTVLGIDGVKPAQGDNFKIMARLIGDPGTSVKIDVQRGGDVLSFTVKREVLSSDW